MTATARDIAFAANDAGISVVPPRQDGTKAPSTVDGTWEQFQEHPPSADQLEDWYSDPQRTGVGFVGGQVSGGLELFEFEGRAAGVVGRFMNLACERGLGDLMNLLIDGYSEKTPSGGLHLIYRCEETGCVKLAKAADGKDLIETKGEGGYMIVAPTNGSVHPTGRSYEQLRGGVDTIPTISPQQRRQLHELAAYFDERPSPEDETPTAPPFTTVGKDGWVSQVIAAYNQSTTWAEVLAGRFTHLHHRRSVSYWHYEGADNVISATTNATGRDTLIVFSGTAQGAGWHIWEGSGKAPSYDRFSAHVLIETGRHDVDARVEIARRLQTQGCGPRRGVDPQTGEVIDDTTFWNVPILAHIRTCAWAQMASPWAVLGNVLARIICQVPVTVVLPDVIHDYASLNLTLALVGPSGSGKGGSTGVARHSVDIGYPHFDTHTLGSGQGIAHGYGHWDKATKTVIRHADSVLFTVEEVDHLVGLAQQNGSTTLAELRRFSMGEKLGHLFVDPTRRVEIDAHSYRGAVIVSVQPARAGMLLNDADGGTPQRFLWLPTIDATAPDAEPDRPDPWTWSIPSADELPAISRFGLRPLPICDTARSAIRNAQRARNRGEGDPLDGHRLLTRERVAAALALLRGYYAITPEDWELARTVMAISDATRARVVATLAIRARQANEARAHQEADRDEVKENRQDQRVARRLLDHLIRQGDWVTGSDLRRDGLASRDRRAFEPAIANLVTAGVVESQPIPQDSSTSRPGIRYRAVIK
jgi:hypothetical protein